MKIQISYAAGEEQRAEAVKNSIVKSLCGVRIKKSDLHPPFKHIYITDGKKPKEKS